MARARALAETLTAVTSAAAMKGRELNWRPTGTRAKISTSAVWATISAALTRASTPWERPSAPAQTVTCWATTGKHAKVSSL